MSLTSTCKLLISTAEDMPNLNPHHDHTQPLAQNHTLGELTQTTTSSMPIRNDMPNPDRAHKKKLKEITASIKIYYRVLINPLPRLMTDVQDNQYFSKLLPGSRVFDYGGVKVYFPHRHPSWRKARREENRLMEEIFRREL
ncbi:hypothetical protein GGX14DRAFT_392627 [Mycena pura]|uniref:Uncharacterized protein n=1 Tax=Mycena pura TaxID=153505 RepID=A0AAD6VQX2_9AGAR|nr:hypothetical protein GGX14DRAFT_392627 [Mycena pura]